jgi:hypothetical protein
MTVEKETKTLEKRPDEKETKMSRKAQFTIQLAGGAIFGAISYVVSAITTANPILVPRIPGWGIAIVDPISIVWVTCFLIFGVEAGFLCCFVGFFTLIPFDTWLGVVGPLMKLGATLSLIIVPIMLLRLYKYEDGKRNSQKLKKPKNYVIYGALGVVLRVFVMLIFNILIFSTLLAGQEGWISLEFMGLPTVSGWTAIIVGVILINLFTSIWDLLFPYMIVFGALDYGLKLDEKFEIW